MGTGRVRRTSVAGLAVAGLIGGLLLFAAAPANAGGPVQVDSETEFRAAWANAAVSAINLDGPVTLTCAGGPTPTRNSALAITVEGDGNTLSNACNDGSDQGVMRSNGTGDVTIEDLTVTGGRAVGFNGGALGVFGAGSDATVRDSTFSNNRAGGSQSGGAIAGDGGTLSVFRSTFTDNTVNGPGSALASGDDITIEETTITGNHVSAPGDEAVATGSGLVELFDSTVSGNDGTGIYAGGGADVRRSSISNNAGVHGINSPGFVSLFRSTVSGNGEDGVAAFGGASLEQSTIHSNADQGVYVSGNAAVVQSTLTGNTTNLQVTGTLTIFASVIAEAGGNNCGVGSVTENGYTVADDATCGAGVDVVATPLQLGPLQDNGGPTRTRMPADTSPLVDVVPLNDCFENGAEGLVDDQRLFSRPGDGEGCDLGAVEVCQDGTFSDVPVTSLFAGDICWMGVQGITTGFAGGVYKPAQAVSRQAMAAFMYRLAGSPPFMDPPVPSFTDVPASSTFYTEIEWMADEGITTGFPGNVYKPSQAVSRQAMSAFMRRLDAGPGVGV